MTTVTRILLREFLVNWRCVSLRWRGGGGGGEGSGVGVGVGGVDVGVGVGVRVGGHRCYPPFPLFFCSG